jgi:hypothetical protein
MKLKHMVKLKRTLVDSLVVVPETLGFDSLKAARIDLARPELSSILRAPQLWQAQRKIHPNAIGSGAPNLSFGTRTALFMSFDACPRFRSPFITNILRDYPTRPSTTARECPPNAGAVIHGEASPCPRSQPPLCLAGVHELGRPELRNGGGGLDGRGG